MKQKKRPMKANGWKSCRSKKRFPDEYSALKAAKTRQREGAPLLRAYDCPGCKGWHLTKKVDR